ncbi:hypothetical protein MSKU3_2127 [Komagataeibacter oboediens]|nr:hypothetical protein MSKU3_2127 [Komagataeibacter oboediens]
MADKAYSVAQGASTSLLASDIPLHGSNPHFLALLTSEHLAAALIFPALLLLALAGFAQPEVLRHGGAKPHPTVIALAEVAR